MKLTRSVATKCVSKDVANVFRRSHNDTANSRPIIIFVSLV